MTSTATANSINGTGNPLAPPLTTDDLEDVLMELNRYEKSPEQKIPNILERYLVFVAKTGSASFAWTKVKPLFRSKLENVIVDFSNVSPADEVPPVPNVDVFNFSGIKNKVFEQLDAFAGIPFTVQRLAELLTSPRRHYKRTDKFMRALEKNMLIVSTVEARATSNNNASESRNSSYLMNGNDYLSNGNGVTNKDTDNSNTSSTASDSSKELASTAQTLQRDNVEDDLDAEMPLVSPPTTPPNPTQLQHENGSSLGSFENDTPVVTKPLLEGLNPKSCPKSPSETDLLLYLGSFKNETNTTAAVVTEPLPEGLNSKPPSETVDDEMVTDQDMVTDDNDEKTTPDQTSNPPSDAKRIRLDEDTKQRSEEMVEPSTSNVNEATAQNTDEDQSKSIMEVEESNEAIEKSSVPTSSSAEPAITTASNVSKATNEATEAATKEVTETKEVSEDASSSTQPEQETTPEAAPATTEEKVKETTNDKTDEPSEVISSTEDNSEKDPSDKAANTSPKSADDEKNPLGGAIVATEKDKEDTSPSKVEKNNEASTSE